MSRRLIPENTTSYLKNENQSQGAKPGPVLPGHDVMTYPSSTPLYQIYVNYSFGKVIVAMVKMRITTLWIADMRQPSDVMRGKAGENCDELCVTGNSTHVLLVHDVNYLSLAATVFVDLIKYSFTINQNKIGKLMRNVGSFDSKVSE